MGNKDTLYRVKRVVDWLIFTNNVKNKRDLADKLGYTESSLSQILNAKVAISKKFINKLSNFSEHLSETWLLTGEGQMLLSTSPDNAQHCALPVAESAPQSAGIPLIPVDAMAGYLSGSGATIMEHDCERYVIPHFKGAEFLIPIKGSSMQPKYNSGDMVACKRLPLDTFFQWNKVYVVDTEQGALIKRIKQGATENTITLISDNPDYEPLEIRKEQINAIALVIGVLRLE